jgi:hypothetical protein
LQRYSGSTTRWSLAFWLTLAICCVTTVWFLFGVTRDLKLLVVTLQKAKRNDADDGTVRGHHNIGENQLIENAPANKQA